jgi:large subunit ribosomal protein L10
MRTKGPRPDKVEAVDEIRAVYGSSSAIILTDYRGLTVVEITALRRKLRDTGGEYHIVKNTLFKRALGDVPPALDGLLNGPTAVAFATGDPVAMTKALLDFLRDLRKPDIQVKGGYLEGKVFTPQQVVDLSRLPPREIILGQVVGTIQAPLNNLAGTLNGILSEFARTLQALVDKQQAEAA